MSRRHRGTGWRALLAALALACVAPFAAAAEPSGNVLVLTSFGYGRPVVDQYVARLAASLSASGLSTENVFVENLDLARNPDPAYRAARRDLLLQQYARRRIALIVVMQQPALNFLLTDLAGLAPQAPLLAVNARLPAGGAGGHHALQIATDFDLPGTLRLALRLLPHTERVVAVVGAGEADRVLKESVQRTAAQFGARLQFEYTDALTMPQLMARLSSLPPHTVVLFTALNVDAAGERFAPLEVAERAIRVARAPVFTVVDSLVGRGALGGSVFRVEDEAARGAQIALALMAGPDTAPPAGAMTSSNVPLVDWRQLERWHADTAALPPEAIVLNRPPALWSEHRGAVISAVLALFALSASSAALWLQNRRRRRAELAALESEARQRVLFEHAPEAVVVTDREPRRIVDVNPKAEELFGRPRTALLNQPIERFYAAAQPGGEPLAESLQRHAGQALEGAEVVFERMIERPDGQHRLCEVRVVRLPASNRRLLRASFVDITDRRRAEDEVHRLNTELEGRVHERTAQLEAANRQLARARDDAEAATRAKSEFLANMSHEIRTPMNAVLGMVDLALRTELAPRQRGYLTRVKSAAASLLVILNDILDFSKIEAGKLEMESREFALAEVLEKLASVVGLRAQEKGLDLLIHVAADVPERLVGDSLRLEQVLINLCSNAVKFTASGEVVVSVRRAAAGGGDVGLQFSVRDTGIGMTPEQAAGLFQPFQQVDASTTRQYGGTGLGLAICRRLVALMGGSIGVTSQLGRGSDFRFEARFGAAEPGARVLPALPASLRGLRVLVVDDSAASRDILQELLAALGLRPAGAGSAAEALAAVQRAAEGAAYDLVLLDWSLPEMDGFALARELRALRLQHAPRLVLLTAYADDAQTRRAVAERLDGCIAKPVTAPHLVDAIASAFGAASAPTAGRSEAGVSSGVPPGLHGRRVLLAEDNDFNQIVACELLSDVAGMRVTIAANGEEAVERARAEAFDAVLMDVQMPLLDGYQATAMIRQDPRLSGLPIIAMTARAMTGDRDKSLAVGMNDYVTKPFEPAQLFAVLAKWLRVAPAPAAADSAAADARPVQFELGRRRCLDRADLYRKLVARFAAQAAAAPADIARALAAGEPERAAIVAHNIISSAGTLGAERLSEAARALQVALDAGESARWPALLAAFEQQHAAAMAALRQHLDASADAESSD